MEISPIDWRLLNRGNEGKHMSSIPVVDFDSHPAFQVPMRAPDHAAAELLMGEIETLCATVRDSTPHREELGHRYETLVVPRLGELSRLATGHPEMQPEFKLYVSGAIELAAEFLRESVLASSLPPRTSGVPDSADVAKLTADGYCKWDADEALARRVWRRMWWERSILRQRARQNPGRHCALALDHYSPASVAIQRALVQYGVLDVASAYLGRPMEFLYAALDHSHSKQSWYRDCYIDAGIPTSRTTYMHFDADADVLKAMLYLSDVDQGSGPFRYVRGSNNWTRSKVRCALEKGFDVQQTRTFPMEKDGLDYKMGYYRPRYKQAEFRVGVMQLPRCLRGSTHFGDDIIDNTPQSQSLLEQEEVFCGRAGTLVLFDGAKGIHRGSLVESGERWAVQIGMRARKGRARTPRFGTRIKGPLRYQLLRASGLVRGNL